MIPNLEGLGQNQVFVTSVADGDRGTRETIPYARKLIASGLRDPRIHELALWFCQAYGAPSYDEPSELRAVFQGVLDHFFYRKHIVGTQSLQPVDGLLRTRSGDCAELNLVLLPSLLGTIGYPTRAVTIKADPTRPNEFSHVYIEAQLSNGQWIPMDAAREGTAFGVEPDYYWEREEFDLTPSGGFMNGYASPVQRGVGATVILQKPKSVFPRRGLGQDDTSEDLDAALTAAPSILTGVAQVVQAAQGPQISPYALQAYETSMSGTGLTASIGSGSTWLIVGILVVAGLFALGGRKKG